jgi:hypothetical protein
VVDVLVLLVLVVVVGLVLVVLVVVGLVVVVVVSPLARSMARIRKEAIWALVTGSSGQYRVLSGGLQPLVTPEAARASMSAWWVLPEVSVNGPEEAASSSNPLTKKVAI